jgi:hypothetical protein
MASLCSSAVKGKISLKRRRHRVTIYAKILLNRVHEIAESILSLEEK